jgi:hypothetical protein
MSHNSGEELENESKDVKDVKDESSLNSQYLSLIDENANTDKPKSLELKESQQKPVAKQEKDSYYNTMRRMSKYLKDPILEVVSDKQTEAQPLDPPLMLTPVQQPLETPPVNDLQITPKTIERTVTLSMCRSIFLTLLIALQLILTLICGVITVYSAFREVSNLPMERSSYWWYFLFNALILLYTYQTFSAIRKKSDNIDALTCSSLFIGLFVIIEIFVISRFFFVAMTPKETSQSFNHFDY